MHKKAEDRLRLLKTAVDKLNILEERLTDLSDQISRERAVADIRKLSDRELSNLVNLVRRSFELSAEIVDQKEEVNKAKKPLVIEAEDFWPTASWAQAPGNEMIGTLALVDGEGKFETFCENLAISYAPSNEATSKLYSLGLANSPSGTGCEQILNLLASSSAVQVSLEPVAYRASKQDGEPQIFKINPGRPSPGIFIREPELARLIIRVSHATSGIWKTIYTDEPRWVPQIGRLRFLQFKSGPFENETLSFALRADGRLENLTYQTKDAALARLAKAGADIGERAAKAREDAETEYRSDVDRARADAQYARDEAKKNMDAVTARQNAEIATLDYRINLTQRTRSILTQQAQSDDAAAERANELAMLNAEIATLRAEKERLELTQTLRNLRQIEAAARN